MSLASTTGKLLLFLFNLLFLITGLVVAVVAIMVELVMRDHSTFVGSPWYTPAMVIGIIGGVIVLTSLFGCCGVIKDNRCFLYLFSGLLFILFVLELGVGVYGYTKSDDLEGVVLKNMRDTMKEYGHNNATTESWNAVQYDLHCCGTYNASDWWNVTTKEEGLPHTCCENLAVGEKCTEKLAFKDGCYTVFRKFLESKSCQLATVAIGISVAQLLSVLVAILLAKHLHRHYEAV